MKGNLLTYLSRFHIIVISPDLRLWRVSVVERLLFQIPGEAVGDSYSLYDALQFTSFR